MTTNTGDTGALIPAGGLDMVHRCAIQFIDFLERRDEDNRETHRAQQWRTHTVYWIILFMLMVHWFWGQYMNPGIVVILKQIAEQLKELLTKVSNMQTHQNTWGYAH